MFDDLLAANEAYAATFAHADVPGPAAKGLAVVTCMDSRIDPLAVLGLQVGDAKVLRNPGGRVTDDVLTALVLGRHLLNCQRVAVIQHTGCKMASATDEQVHAIIKESAGLDTRSLVLGTMTDQKAALEGDVQRVRSSPYLPGVEVGGFLYDITTGRIEQVA